MSRLPADDPWHRGIMAQSLGVVDILVSRKPPEHRLPQHAEQGMPAVLPVRASASSRRPNPKGRVRRRVRGRQAGRHQR